MTYIQKGGLFSEWQPGLGSALTYSAPQWLLKHSARVVWVKYLPCVKYLYILVLTQLNGQKINMCTNMPICDKSGL